MAKVFLSAGHGGSDPGAVAYGMKEKDLNLAVMLACNEELVRHGVVTVLSRTKDENDPVGQEVTEDFIVITLNDDNTVSFTKEGETSQGTWKDGEEDNTVVITVAHVINITATLDGGTMVFDWDLLGRVTLEK